ncbi:hypothetical protein Sgly_0790 [Syntrophobotulus glycolicus DSM 8271]|uniref:XkdX family protein n=1 Tax=Syntrophobotulus glycolicus (strain DSM 8271 / FlGlyR) TaxID=645991 RepID=F0T183_SYNGF|nr:XkdX family protein [Syntrophobotulus glycolicus]ADY55147.1 hypothetical protein Sgly_0790 [Syntrophobotulus glycolicus DSM 8271]
MLDFKTINRYYKEKYWSKKMIWNAVVKGYITAAEYEEITGESYQA